MAQERDNNLLGAAKYLMFCLRALQQLRCSTSTMDPGTNDGFATFSSLTETRARNVIQSKQTADCINQYSCPHYCLSGSLTEPRYSKSLSNWTPDKNKRRNEDRKVQEENFDSQNMKINK